MKPQKGSPRYYINKLVDEFNYKYETTKQQGRFGMFTATRKIIKPCGEVLLFSKCEAHDQYKRVLDIVKSEYIKLTK